LKNARCKLLIQLSKIVLNTQDVKKPGFPHVRKLRFWIASYLLRTANKPFKFSKKNSAQLLQGRVFGLGLLEAFTRRQSRVPKS